MQRVTEVKINYMNGDSERIALINVMQYDRFGSEGDIIRDFQLREQDVE